MIIKIEMCLVTLLHYTCNQNYSIVDGGFYKNFWGKLIDNI